MSDIGTTGPANKLSVVNGNATVTKASTDSAFYLPVVTGGSKTGLSDNMQTRFH